MYREAKAWTSSDFEAALLKCTRPDDHAPKTKHVESIVISVAAFDAFIAPDCDPYALLLHKIWSRLVEPSPYTVAKAIYLYRRVLLGHPSLFKARKHLGKARSVKSKTLYFDHRVVLDLDIEPGIDLAKWTSFLFRYWVYVDACWLSCVDAKRISPEASITNVVEAAANLATLASRALFTSQHSKKMAIPSSCPLVDACVLQVIEDIYALHFVLLLCFAIDPRATFDATAVGDHNTTTTADFWNLLRWTLDKIHPPHHVSGLSSSSSAAAVVR